MITLVAEGFFTGAGQGARQIVELVAAFGLTALIGLEREIRGKSAGLCTQTIVGTSAALILLVSKYGFGDIVAAGTVILDPSRVAAQIVSGIGFLGAGLIITRRGAVIGLTTAAAIWESAAVGMAAAAGLLLLAVVVTMLHFVIVIGIAPSVRRMATRLPGSVRVHVIYQDGRGILRQLLETCDAHGWHLTSLITDSSPVTAALPLGQRTATADHVGVTMTLSGSRVIEAPRILADIEGVTRIDQLHDDAD
ncbi:Mg2+ transporter-C (MgtC) family protein [Mycolicibacter heraklionensis]|uniref:Mg2+ transporter-C (MgtC) family protein n=1 Tax=Mycolicibacter heraklionensis TaxID=512402 RepID=A0ABR5FJ33_9MYCO|nr:MgtC/SapB family protein [Mycolicibacter heraklionensis]KLO30869.1 Mg2+ transporter-C (MgtC) family protein [Mycolicibacter heraklionensis]